jgi:hypothetical protein
VAKSYLNSSADNVSRGFSLGWQQAAEETMRERAIQAELEKKKIEEAELTKRYDLQLRNSLAVKAQEMAAKAQDILRMDTKTAAHDFNLRTYNNAIDILNDEETELQQYLKPEMRGNVENAAALEGRIKAIRANKAKLASYSPKSVTEFVDYTKLIDPPKQITQPKFTTSYQNYLESKNALPGARLDKIENTPSPTDKEFEKRLEETRKNRLGFIGVTNSVYAARQPFTDGIKRYKTYDDWKVNDPDGYKSAFENYDKARVKWNTEAPKLISTLEDSDIVGDDVVNVVSKTKSNFNNLRTFDDFDSWIRDLNTRKYDDANPEDAAARDAVIKINQYLLNQGGVQ